VCVGPCGVDMRGNIYFETFRGLIAREVRLSSGCRGARTSSHISGEETRPCVTGHTSPR
jgi:hypothetical protein